MKSRHVFAASLLGAAALLSGCNDANSPQATDSPITQPTNPPQSFSSFVASLIAMITGNSCDTALPVEVNSLNVSESNAALDANAITPGCPS